MTLDPTMNGSASAGVQKDYSFLDPTIDHRLAADIDAAEADKLLAYQDSLGIWTIGRGHVLPPAAPGRSWAGFTIIQSTSDRYFNGDLLDAIALAKKWPEFSKCDTNARVNALCELAFNMGSKWGQFVHTRAALEAQNWQGVHDGLLDSLWARQVQPHGIWEVGYDANGSEVHGAELPGRATRIAGQFLTGAYRS